MLSVHLVATAAMAGLIWFVQVVHYPLFAGVGRDGFAAYEARHTRRTSWVVGPFMAVEGVAAIALFVWPVDGVGRGLPLLAGFPVRHLLIEELAEESLLVGSVAMLGLFGFMLSGFRMLTVFTGSEHRTWEVGEKWPQIILTVSGIVSLLITGIFPGWLSSGLLYVLESFSNLY